MTPFDRQQPDGEDVQRRVHDDGRRRDVKRRLHVVLRLEPGDERLLEAEEAETKRIDRDGTGDAHGRKGIEVSALVDDLGNLGREHEESGRGREHDEHQGADGPRKRRASAVEVVLREETCECRQENRTEGDADDAERKVHQTLGIADDAGRPFARDLGEELVEHIVDLDCARTDGRNADVAPDEPDLRIGPTREAQPRRNAGTGHAPEHEDHLDSAGDEDRHRDAVDALVETQFGKERDPTENTDPTDIEQTRHEAGGLEASERIENPHAEGRAADEDHVGQERLHEADRQQEPIGLLALDAELGAIVDDRLESAHAEEHD